MPTYVFICDPDKGGCGYSFELQTSMDKVHKLKPTCSSCNKRKSVHRHYLAENKTVLDVTPKTLGALAEHHTNKKSQDELAHIKYQNTKYKNKPLEIPLGPGMSQIERDSQGHIIVSKEQTKTDKRK